MGKVEAQRIVAYKRTFLLHMVAEHLLQSIIEQVGRGVVGGTSVALFHIHAGRKRRVQVLRKGFYYMHTLVVLALGINDLHRLVGTFQHSGVAHLTAHLAIERCAVEY